MALAVLAVTAVVLIASNQRSARALPTCTIDWAGPASGGDWGDPLNWSAADTSSTIPATVNRVPDSTDVACIAAGHDVVVSVATAGQAGSVQAHGALDIEGRLDLSAPDTSVVDGLLTVAGTYNAPQAAATLGDVVVKPGGSLTVGSTAEPTTVTSLDIAGGFSGTGQLTDSGTLKLSGDGYLGQQGTVDVAGAATFSGASTNPLNAGPIVSHSTTLHLAGPADLAAGTVLALGGELQHDGAFVVHDGASIVPEQQQFSFVIGGVLLDVALPPPTDAAAGPLTATYVGDVVVGPSGVFRRTAVDPTTDVHLDVPLVDNGGRVDVASGSLTLAHDNTTADHPRGTGAFTIEPGGVLRSVVNLPLDGVPFTGGGDLVGTVDDPTGDASLGNMTLFGVFSNFHDVDVTGALSMDHIELRAHRVHAGDLDLNAGSLTIDGDGSATVDGNLTSDNGTFDSVDFATAPPASLPFTVAHQATFLADTELDGIAMTLDGPSSVSDSVILNRTTITNTGAMAMNDGLGVSSDTESSIVSSGSIAVAGTVTEGAPISSSGLVSLGDAALTVPLVTSSGVVDTGTGSIDDADSSTDPTVLRATAGVVKGTGTITGDVDNVAGTMSPGHSPGTITIGGNYQQGEAASFLEEVNGTAAGQFDRLIVRGTATLAGALDVVTGGGFVPHTGDTLAFITSFGGVKGGFATPFSGAQVDALHSYVLQANTDQVALAGISTLPTVSISDASVVEGDNDSVISNLVFTVGLSDFGDAPASVIVTTADGTATAPGDYTPVSTTVTFAPGTLTQTVIVPVVGDTVVEPDETLTATLSAPSGATLGAHPTGTGTIVNDDAVPAPPAPQVPGAPTAVTAIGAPGQATVHWLPPGTDGGSPITGFTVVADPGGVRVSTCADCTSVVVGNLTNGTTFTFRVFATNAVGDGPPSEPSAPTLVAGPSSPPRDLTASAGRQLSSAHLAWNAPADDGGSALRSYTVHVLAPAGDPLVGTPVVVPSSATTAEVVGLRPATEYRFDVVATNDIGTSGPSLPATLTLTPPATAAFVVPPAAAPGPQAPPTPDAGPPGPTPPGPTPPGPVAPRPPVKPRAVTPAPVPPAAPAPAAPATGDVTAPALPPVPPEAPKTPKLNVTGRAAQRGTDRGRRAPVDGADHPCGDVFLFLDGRAVGQASGATNGSFAGQKVAVPRNTAPGRHTLTSSCSASGQPVEASTVLVVTARDLHRTSFANSVPAPNDLAAVLKTLVASAALAALLVLLIAFPAELFNATFEENYDEIRGWFRPLVRAADMARRITGRFSRQILVGLFLIGGSVLYALLDPGIRLDRLTFAFAGGLLVALAMMTFGFGAATAWYMRRRHGDQGRMTALPGSFLIAVVCVGLSRLAHFQPGYLYGLLVGYAFQQELSDEEEGRATAVASAWMLFLTVAAWLAWIPVRSAAGGQHPALALVVADAALAAVVVAGIEGLVFGLLPLRFVAGEKLAHWNRAIWAVLFSAGMFLFVYLLLRPGSGYAISAGGASLVPVIIGVSAFAGFSLAFWAYFRFRRPRINRVEGERIGVSTTVPLVREGR